MDVEIERVCTHTRTTTHTHNQYVFSTNPNNIRNFTNEVLMKFTELGVYMHTTPCSRKRHPVNNTRWRNLLLQNGITGWHYDTNHANRFRIGLALLFIHDYSAIRNYRFFKQSTKPFPPNQISSINYISILISIF